MRLHWELRKLQCLNLYTRVLMCHVTRVISLAAVGALTEAQFPSSQYEEYFLHPAPQVQVSVRIYLSDGVPAAWEHLEQQSCSSRCLWTLKWAFSQHQPRFHNSSLANKQPVCAQKEKGSGSGTGEIKKPHCKKCACVPQGTTVPGRHQHLETSLGLLRKRKERNHQHKLVLASLGFSKPQLVEVMADLTTLVSSNTLLHFSRNQVGLILTCSLSKEKEEVQEIEQGKLWCEGKGQWAIAATFLNC